jgi:glycosyltransferase involved in cell wall biosynthesis
MESTGQINSESYWDTRFKQNWESCDGPWQTRFFYQVAVGNLPAWFMSQLKHQSLTLVDWGCAQGDGADVWASYISPERIAGVDFSAVAVEQAAERYPSIRFLHEDWLDENQDAKNTYDIVFSSNTLEHFHSPYAVLPQLMRRARKAVILTLPYKEVQRIDEHFYTFLPENIPLRLSNGFRLCWAMVVDCRNLPMTQWGGDQIVLLYAAPDWTDELGLTLSDSQIWQEDYATQAARLQETLEEQARQAIGSERSLEERAARIIELDQSLNQRVEQVAHLSREGAGQRDRIQALEHELQAKGGEFDRVVRELSERSSELAQKTEGLNAANQAIEAIGAQLAHANQYLSLILGSRSWRVASAMRKVGNTLLPWRGRGSFDGPGNALDVPASIWRRRVHYVFNRYVDGVRRHGLIGSIAPAVRASTSLSSMWLRKKWRSKLYEKRLVELRNIITSHKGFVDIFHVPMGWKTPLFQRFQHMSLQASQMGGLALYGGHLQVDVDLFVYERCEDGVVVFDALDQRVVDLVFSSLRQCEGKKVLRLQSIDLATRREDVERFLNDDFVVVYEYIDEISEEITGQIPSFVLERHKWLLDEPRVLVVATSDKIYEQVRQQRADNCLLSTNGVDLHHWRSLSRPVVPEDMKPAVQAGRVIVGYHGALATWIDYDLLGKIAEDGRFELVLIGYAHDSSLTESGLLDRPHVHFLGSKSYFELNRYAASYDIGILPFKKYELTESVSPVKLFEYMAAGKPVVTTDLRECTKYKSCLVSGSHEQFMANLSAAVSLKSDATYLQSLGRDAEENSWRGKALAIFNKIGLDTAG